MNGTRVRRAAFLAVLVASASLGAASVHADEDDDIEALEGITKKAVAALESKNYDEGIRLLKKELLPGVESATSISDAKKATFRTTGYYNLACAYSLKRDKAAALDWFEKAVQSGFTDWDHIAGDSDLDGIRSEARFKRIVAKGKGEKVPEEEKPTGTKPGSGGALTADEAEAARLFHDAEAAYEAGKFVEARDLLKRAIEKDAFPVYVARREVYEAAAKPQTDPLGALPGILAGAVEDIAVAYVNNKPKMQERLVAEALRFVERSFTGFSMVAGDRCVVNCTGFAKKGTRRNSDDTITANLDMTFDVHYAKGVHVRAVARVPVEARLRVEVQTLKRGDGSRRRIAVVNIQTPPVDFEKLQLTDSSGSNLGTAMLETIGALFGQWILDRKVNPRLQAGFTLFWEQGRGTCLYPSAGKQAGERLAWLEASDIDAEPVRQMLQETDDAAWTGRLVQIPAANAAEGVDGLRVVGGGSATNLSNAYAYRFPVGVFPVVGLDKGLLTAFANLSRAASGKLVQQPDGVVLERPSRVRVRAETDKGTVKVGIAGPKNQEVLAWKEVTADSPLDVEVNAPAGMATLWIVNEAERVTEELTAPTLKLTVEDVRVGRAAAGDFVGTWRALLQDESGAELRADFACLEDPAKCGVRVLKNGTEAARAVGTWKVDEDKILITEVNDTVTTCPYKLIGTHLRLEIGGKPLIFERVR